MAYVPIVLGTARKGRQSEHVAHLCVQRMQQAGVETELIDVRSFSYGRTNQGKESPEIEQFSKKVQRADALLVVSPEYNHSYPGELKILLDHLYEEYVGKRVGLCTVSAGGFGGVRVAELLKLYFVTVGAHPLPKPVAVAKVQDVFVEGQLQDTSYIEKIDSLIQRLTQKQ